MWPSRFCLSILRASYRLIEVSHSKIKLEKYTEKTERISEDLNEIDMKQEVLDLADSPRMSNDELSWYEVLGKDGEMEDEYTFENKNYSAELTKTPAIFNKNENRKNQLDDDRNLIELNRLLLNPSSAQVEWTLTREHFILFGGFYERIDSNNFGWTDNTRNKDSRFIEDATVKKSRFIKNESFANSREFLTKNVVDSRSIEIEVGNLSSTLDLELFMKEKTDSKLDNSNIATQIMVSLRSVEMILVRD